MTKLQVDKFLADLRSALAVLESLPVPTIAAIDGPALGGGLELSFACDMRVAGAFMPLGRWLTPLSYLPKALPSPRSAFLRPVWE